VARQYLVQAAFGHFHAEVHVQQDAHPGERDARAALVHAVEQEVDLLVRDRSSVIPMGAVPARFSASFSLDLLRDVVQASRRHASQRAEMLHLTSGRVLIHRGRDRVVHALVVRKSAARSLVDRARPRVPTRGFRGHAQTTRGAHPRPALHVVDDTSRGAGSSRPARHAVCRGARASAKNSGSNMNTLNVPHSSRKAMMSTPVYPPISITVDFSSRYE